MLRNIHGWYSISDVLSRCGLYSRRNRDNLRDAVETLGFGTKNVHIGNRIKPYLVAHRDGILAAIRDDFFGPVEGNVRDMYTRIKHDSYYDIDQLVRLSAKKVKARCYLDAYRGQPLTNDIKSSGGWRGEVLNYCPSRIVPDTNWYTGCTPEIWEIAKDIPAEPLYVWLYLLGEDFPLSLPERELAGRMGLVRIYGSLDHLESARLLTRTPTCEGVTQEIVAVHNHPVFHNGRDKDLCRALSENAVRLTSDGRKTAITIYRGQVTQFCRERNLNRGGILRVIQGKQAEYKGWRLA